MHAAVNALHTGKRAGPARAFAFVFTLATALALVAMATDASAAMYKWTDANGHVVYSDQPPPGDIKSELIGAAPPPANPNAVKEMAQKDADLKKRQQDRVGAEVKAEKDKQQDTRRRDLCLVVRGKLKEMRSGAAVYKYDDKGARVVLDPTARAEELGKQVENEMRYCGEPSA
ncbi:MAG: DUF4124 domain-containing protein [Betaproteobacteria bacterium]